jgi:hypothetical protein
LDLQQEVTDNSFQVNNDPVHTPMPRHAKTSWVSDFLYMHDLFSPHPALFSEIALFTSRSTVDLVKQYFIYLLLPPQYVLAHRANIRLARMAD